MSGHEFEKQVRQKLNDLKLTPTAKVWENIEESMHKRKRRPTVIFWLPLLLIGLGAAGYLFYDLAPQGNGIVQKQDNQQDRPQIAVTDAAAQKQDVSKTPEANHEAISVPQQKSNKDANRGDRVSESPQDESFEPQVNRKSNLNNTRADQPSISANLNELVLKETKSNQRLFVVPPSTSKNSDIFPFGHFLTIARQYEVTSPKDLFSPTAQKTNSPSISAGKKQQKAKSNKFSYGVSGFAGISSVNEGKLLGFNNARVEDVSTVAPFAPQQPYKPSSLSPGFTYSLGAFVQRELSKKMSLSVGLNYLQMNTRNKVGNQINNRAIVNNGASGYYVVTNYFTIERDDKKEYRNRYHFIEMPVELHTRINRSNKLPIALNTGITVSQLIKSNSLHFDGTTGVYYHNDKLLNQTQVAAKAGLSITVLNNTTRPISIGPSARYNVSKILHKDVSGRKNFMSLGVDARIFIK